MLLSNLDSLYQLSNEGRLVQKRHTGAGQLLSDSKWLKVWDNVKITLRGNLLLNSH